MEDDDENFLDDEWDVPDEQLNILEQKAIGSTQHESLHGNEPLHMVSRPPNLPLTETLHRTTLIHAANGTNREVNLNEHGFVGSENYDFDAMIADEENVLPVGKTTEIPVPQKLIDEMTQREQWRLNRFGPGRQDFQQHGISVHQNQEPVSFDSEDPVNARQNEDNLRSMLEELRRERDLLSQNLQSTSRDLRTARGEIAVIRENTSKESKSFERQINLLRKQMQDEATRYQASIRAKDEQHGQLVTSHSFLKHELDEQMQKMSHLQRQIKEKPLSETTRDINLTPRKSVLNSINDGFNDDEVSFASPTKSPAKSGRRSKQSTPTNRKRKQQTNELDIQPLALRMSSNGEHSVTEVTALSTKAQKAAIVVRKDHETARHLYLVQNVMSFRPLGGSQTLIERLAFYSFPTESPRTLSSLFLSRTANLKGVRLPGELLEVFIDSWTQALKERYYEPIPLLIDAINHLLDIDPTLIDKEILNKLLPTLTDTADINATVRFHLADKSKTWTKEKKRRLNFNPYADSIACLDLLYNVACLVLDDFDLLLHFWRLIKTDHVLLALTCSQPIPVISLMLQLLSTSILPETFGNVCGSSEEQLKMETYITDRICFLLWENMRQVDEKQPPYSRAEVCKLRLEALNLLSQFAVTSSQHPHKSGIESHHGTAFMINHPTAIARLVRSIYDEVDNMYNLYPTHSLHAELINRAISILHHLLTSPQAENINLTMKLAGTPVGVHKFRVVLTRLAFRDGTVLDKGVTDDTVGKATEILEEHVTPDEAAALLEAFGKSSGEPGRMNEGHNGSMHGDS